jgi:hypothetical protein
MSIQHAGVQLKTQNGKHVPFSKQKDVQVLTISTDPKTFIYDAFMYLAKQDDIKKPKIDPLLKQFPGNDIENVKIQNLVNGVKGFARSCEINGMFGWGALAHWQTADDFLRNFLGRYEEKAMLDINAKKRDKASTPEAQARADQDRLKVQQGLDMVRGLF